MLVNPTATHRESSETATASTGPPACQTVPCTNGGGLGGVPGFFPVPGTPACPLSGAVLPQPRMAKNAPAPIAAITGGIAQSTRRRVTPAGGAASVSVFESTGLVVG